jgi:hypothetical protein
MSDSEESSIEGALAPLQQEVAKTKPLIPRMQTYDFSAHFNHKEPMSLYKILTVGLKDPKKMVALFAMRPFQ